MKIILNHQKEMNFVKRQSSGIESEIPQTNLCGCISFSVDCGFLGLLTDREVSDEGEDNVCSKDLIETCSS
jgi:hypothetical protein